MLQSLLPERFHLALHRQTKEMAAYVLILGNNGPKFRDSKAEGESDIQPDPKRMTVAVRRVPVAQLVELLWRFFQVPIIDQTGLAGRYDITIDIAKYIPQSGERVDPLEIIQTGLQGELGLKLDSPGRVWGEAVTEKLVWHVVKEFAGKIGVNKLAPDDLWRSCAHLCRAAGAELQQIQFLPGHISVQTTERYLGCTQRIASAVTDKIGIEPAS
jgi:Protein of unknown function (DUF3738)